jgi:hypothetical protein
MNIDPLLAFDDTRLKLGAAKLTHVGEQTGPVPTVLIQSYYHVVALQKFHTWRTAGLSYGNDDLPIILNFSVSPQELRSIFAEVKRVWSTEEQENRPSSLSFTGMVDAPEGIQGAEVLFTYRGGVELHRALAGAIDQDNKIGQIVLRNQRESAYAG